MESQYNSTTLTAAIKQWAIEIGFCAVGITDIELTTAGNNLNNWLQRNLHGEMQYMQRHGTKRWHPEQLVANTKSIICCALNYLPHAAEAKIVLNNSELAYISRSYLGRDYHKVMRKKLKQLAKKISENIGDFNHRCFVDSAPVMEKSLAVKSGIGWQGKNSLIINKNYGSRIFLGEIYTDLLLTADNPDINRCGKCNKCQKNCPTNTIIAPGIINANRCISYLTLEYRGIIPQQLWPLIGNRIFGCDDCQLVCPWNQNLGFSTELDFTPRNNLDTAKLIELFQWSEEEFIQKTAGSAIRRIGYECWLRNIAIALNNAPQTTAIINALKAKKHYPSELLQAHIKI